ncbi:hypothetical protein [Haloarchaeobius sp. DYHT-AS-18]|uniref:hypothetical protein n=1 Tax=Haloarchaeobius sp. DYHT-AS-18 TaxID=3446117 RepID=UPI003EBBC8B8
MNHRFRFVSFLTVALVCALALGAGPVAADGDQTVGICMVGVDSPCNGDHDENATKDGVAEPVNPDEFPPDPDGTDPVRPTDPEPNWRDGVVMEPINDFVDDVPLMQQTGVRDDPVDSQNESGERERPDEPIPTEPYIVCVRAPCELPTAEPLPEKLPSAADGDGGIAILVPADEHATAAVSASNAPGLAPWYDFDLAPVRFDSNPFHLFARLFGFFF